MTRKMRYRSPTTKAAADAQRRRNVWKARSAGLMNRKGVPNGWTRPKAEEARRNAQNEAEWLMPVLLPAGWDTTTPLGAVAAEAFAVALTMARNASAPPDLRLAAARIVLEWAVPIPEGTSKPTRAEAAAWLDGVAAAVEARRSGEGSTIFSKGDDPLKDKN